MLSNLEIAQQATPKHIHEIAEQMNIPIGTVKTRIHIARKVLKNKLKMYA